MIVVSKLKVILAERDIKVTKFADDLGISRATMTNLLKKDHVPSLLVAYRIAEALDLSVEEIWQKK